MKKRISKKKIRKGVLSIILLTTLFILINELQKIKIYDNLNIDMSNDTFEYGNSVDLMEYISNNEDYEYSIIKDLNTSKVGDQEVEIKIEYKGISKIIPIALSVVDTTAPNIELKKDNITIDEGSNIDLKENVSKVTDNNQSIEYKDISCIADDDTNYFTINPNGFDKNKPGEYKVIVIAKDKVGNKTEKSFKITVEKVMPSYSYIVTNPSSNDKANKIVSIATSLVGSRYVAGGSTPQTGFDCSGFVQYVYSQVGKSVSRSASTQAYDGVGISITDAQPGDIMSWGHNGMITHSTIYLGNGKIVHAINENQGVIISDINNWTNYDILMSIRRVA